MTPIRPSLRVTLMCVAVAVAASACERFDAVREQARQFVASAARDVPALRGVAAVHDFAADSLGLPEPRHERLDRWYEAALPSPLAQTRAALRRAFFAGDFETVDRAFADAHAAYVQGSSPTDETLRLFFPLRDTGLAGIARCEQWVRAMPRSYVAHMVCGAIWQQGAWMARSQEAARKVSDTRFALMRARLKRSNELLQQAITLEAKPVQALTVLADNQHLLSDHRQAGVTLERALALMPAHAMAHEVAARYARPEWGGSEEEAAAAVQRAKRAGVHPDWIATLEDHQLALPWKTPTPGAEKLYWEKVLAEHETYQRLEDFAMYYLRLKNWRDALPVLERSIRAHPHVASSYYWRARARAELGDLQAALADYRLAAAMGDENAINDLVYAHLQGGLTLPARDLAGLVRLCRFAAGLGSPAGANCLASGHWEGALPGLPRDGGQALAWHLLAARGGHPNSQHDIGWLLMSRKLAEVPAPDARQAGIFWLQRSAEQGHTFAIRKLEEAGIALDSADPRRRR